MEAEPPGLVQGHQPGQEQATEQLAEHAHRQQEGRARRNPTLPVQRQSATRHDHVDVRVMGHRRTPGVQDGGDTDAGAQMLWVGGDGGYRFRRRLEQQPVDRRLVLPRDVGNLGRQCEDDMEVPDREEVGLALGQPCTRGRALAPRAVPVAAGVIGNPPVPAVGTGFDVPAHDGGAAMFDGRHDLGAGRGSDARRGQPGTQDLRHGRCRRPRWRRACPLSRSTFSLLWRPWRAGRTGWSRCAAPGWRPACNRRWSPAWRAPAASG